MTVDRTHCRLTRVLAALALTGLAGCQQQNALPEKPPAMVQAMTVELTDDAPTVTLTGEIRAQAQTDLSFRASGRITERNADVGSHVTADQVLAKIDPEQQQANVTAAEAAVRAAEAQLRQASSTFERQKTLFSRGYTTRRDYDQAEESFRTAQGSLDAAKAQLAVARDQLTQTVLRAGVAGVITTRNAEVGQVVQAAQPVFVIAPDGPRDAVFNVHESLFIQEPVEQTVEIRLLSDPNVRVTGKVREVSPTVDPTSGTVRVKIGIERPPAAMTLGAAVSGEGRFRPCKAIVLPWNAVSSQEGQPAVWIVDPASMAVSLRPIVVDRYDTGRIVVREGLRPGETVVTAGAQLLRLNQTIALAKGEAR
jgi:RND family efflux transporter MFP subunit